MIVKTHRCCLFVLVLLLVSSTVFAQNPFTDRRESTTSIYQRNVPGFIVEWSRRLQEKIATLTRNMQTETSAGPGVLAFFFAVVFGMIHVAGPGHGKIFTFTYFGSKQARLREGLLLSALINIIDSASAGTLVFVGYGVLSVVFSTFQADVSYYVRLISYGFLILFASAHLVVHAKEHHHEDHSSDGPMKPWMLALSVGMVPCPVSTMLLIFGVANNVILFSVLMVLGLSLGGFITMSVLSISIIAGKTGLSNLLHGRSAERALHILEIAFSSAMVAIGVILFLSTLI